MIPYITPYLVRVLVENTMNGGGGHLPKEVGDMTPDEFLMCLSDIKWMEHKKIFTKKPSKESLRSITKDGKVKVRTADGTVIEMPVSKGKSVAARLREAEEAKKKGRRKRRRR